MRDQIGLGNFLLEPFEISHKSCCLGLQKKSNFYENSSDVAGETNRSVNFENKQGQNFSGETCFSRRAKAKHTQLYFEVEIGQAIPFSIPEKRIIWKCLGENKEMGTLRPKIIVAFQLRLSIKALKPSYVHGHICIIKFFLGISYWGDCAVRCG